MYHLWVTVTLTSDLVFRIIVSGANHLYDVGIPNLVFRFLLGWRSGAYHFGSILTLTSGLISMFFISEAYLLYYSLLSSNVSYARPIPLRAFVTLL